MSRETTSVCKTNLVYLVFRTPKADTYALPASTNMKSPRANICGVLPIGSVVTVARANDTCGRDLRGPRASSPYAFMYAGRVRS